MEIDQLSIQTEIPRGVLLTKLLEMELRELFNPSPERRLVCRSDFEFSLSLL